jgi:glutaconate CoA-transferase subunit B
MREAGVAAEYTMQELMVVAGAREIHDDDVVFVGMRLPLLAFQLAKETHALHAIGIFENGILRDKPADDVLYTMGDNPNVEGAIWATSMLDIMSLLQNGSVSLGFIGGAEIDRFGNLNTTYIGGKENVRVRLPGSGGGSDIASLSQRLVILMNHEKRRFLEKVSYITSPGYGSGRDWRKRNGLRGGGPSAVITTKGILRFDAETREMILDSVHPGVTVKEILENTGWNLRLAPRVEKTKSPTRSELRIIRKYDAHGFWTRSQPSESRLQQPFVHGASNT